MIQEIIPVGDIGEDALDNLDALFIGNFSDGGITLFNR
jgi:hypothetical protein